MNQDTRTFFGHPRALGTLFFTELWERFSFYGMRALLMLFMTDADRGGMGLSEKEAGAIYGLYTFGVYALALPGGWLADRLLGKRRAVLHGSVLIALGHYSLAIPNDVTFFLGLGLIALGTGLLKPNVSAIVGDLYEDKGARRDAGFSIFYMGINIGALAPLVCSPLAEIYDWHLGFGVAGVGMTLGVAAYLAGYGGLRGTGELRPELATPEALAVARRQLGAGLAVVIVIAAAIVGLSASGILPLTLASFADAVFVVVSVIAALYFAYIIVFVCRDNVERRRVGVCAILFVGAGLFWSGYEQAGSSMNLFARDYTDRVVFGWQVPTGWLQAVNPLFIILLAPVMGWLWGALGRRNPSLPVKFGLGLLLLGTGFLVLAWGDAQRASDTERVAMTWLVVTYFFHTVGELCLSPVGLSSVTKLAPERLVSQMMGTWFMGTALGNLIAGLTAGYMKDMPTSELFTIVAMLALGGGLVFLLFSPLIRKMTAGID